LDPARRRPNLTIIDEALATKLPFTGRRAVGVEYVRGSSSHTVQAAQILLSAGVYHTPQLLMLSGVGPPRELERLGIHVIHGLEGVGGNYQDHAVVVMGFVQPPEFQRESDMPQLRCFLMVKSDPSRPEADMHILMRPPGSIDGFGSLMPVSLHLLEQRNRGRVSLASADPQRLPLVDAGMSEDPDDLAAMTAAMRFVMTFTQDAMMAPYYGSLRVPDADENWARFALTTHDSYHHGVGTCKMGPAEDSLAVVDQRLKVHGMENLWVADASIMPTIPHANTNLAAIMIGEVVADVIRAEPRK
jgi:choline dehydrogenase